MAEPFLVVYAGDFFLKRTRGAWFIVVLLGRGVMAVVFIFTKSHSAVFRYTCQGQFHPAVENGGFH
jgi:uncharacterized membrane protein